MVSRPEHRVFHTPIDVARFIEGIEAPTRYQALLREKQSTLATIQVLQNTQPEGGVLAIASGFTDSPDVEFVATGISSMGPDHPAIGRHGRFVLWGFHGHPRVMTMGGQKLFLNLIDYAQASRQATTLVRRKAHARSFFGKPPHLVPYVWGSGGSQFQIDVDCQTLGIANYDHRLLDWIAEHLTTEPDRSIRLLSRYVPDAPRYGFGDWLAKNRTRLFFSDWGGYRWFLAAPTEGSKR